MYKLFRGANLLEKVPGTSAKCMLWGHCRIQVQVNAHLFLLSKTPQGCVRTSHLLSGAFLLFFLQECVWEGPEPTTVEIYHRAPSMDPTLKKELMRP